MKSLYMYPLSHKYPTFPQNPDGWSEPGMPLYVKQLREALAAFRDSLNAVHANEAAQPNKQPVLQALTAAQAYLLRPKVIDELPYAWWLASVFIAPAIAAIGLYDKYAARVDTPTADHKLLETARDAMCRQLLTLLQVFSNAEVLDENGFAQIEPSSSI